MNLMKLKGNNVQVAGLRSELIIAIMIAQEVYREYGYDFIITSITDGKHSKTSLHYSGAAVDLRINHIDTKQELDEIVLLIMDALNIDYDVVLEKTHIHIEFQPKRRG